MTELREQGEEVGRVVGAGVLPVEVDAVEEAGLVGDGGGDVAAAGEVAAEEDVHTGADEGLALGGLGVGGEVGGAALEGDEDFEARVEALELGDLVEVAVKGRGGVVGAAVDGVLGGEGDVGVGVGVGDRAAAVGDEALGVVDLVELVGSATSDEVFDEVVVVQAPLAEVADDQRTGGVGAGGLRVQSEGRGEEERQGQESAKGGGQGGHTLLT